MSIVLTALLAFSHPGPALVAHVPVSSMRLAQDEFKDRHAAASNDIGKLWALHAWCLTNSRTSEARKLAKQIIRLDGEHKGAREALSHVWYDGNWFTSPTALARHRRAEDQRKLENEGLVRIGEDRWVPESDAPFHRMGWQLDEASGKFISPGEVFRRELDAKQAAQGMMRYDMGWIAPAEQEFIDAGLWKCGDQWLSIEEANAYHASGMLPWEAVTPEGRFIIVSNCTRKGVENAARWADGAAGVLDRIFDARPTEQKFVTVLSNLAQYNEIAGGGTPKDNVPGMDSSGWASLHYAFLAELYFNADPQVMDYNGMGFCYYAEEDEVLARHGLHAVRYAAALSYMEAIDPSWETISYMMSDGLDAKRASLADFWAEKRIPLWLRFGAASCAARYFFDPSIDDEDAIIDWALDNLRKLGGLRPLEELFDFAPSTDDAESSRKWLREVGVPICYILNGGNPKVKSALRAFTRKLHAGGSVDAEIAHLRAALIANEKDIRAFFDL
ncbi:MAG: hypothetical protein ACI841_000096 [Planctomycetota bacterium]|jgi:hypothetical protein